jgi:NAD-dependent DNA ligase
MDKNEIIKLNKNPKKYGEKITIDELQNILTILSEAYYNTGDSLVADEVYDELIDVLKERDPKNTFLKSVGAKIKGTKELVKLPYEMGSLSKIKPGSDELNKWGKKYKGPYFLSDKLDGVSAQIYVNHEGKVFLYSRGDGIEGQNISHLLKFFVSKKTTKKLDKGMSIRGELIISRENFKKISNIMKNARNAVAGLVNAKDFNEKIAELTEFVAYSILNPRYHYDEQIKLLNDLGFKVVVTKKIEEISENSFKEYLTLRKKNSDYEIDGIVCVDDSKIYPHVGGYPDNSFAFKMLTADQIIETTVKDVLWEPSKDGYLKPKIKIEPVELTGTTITYATAFNAKYIVDNNIGPGAKIEIVRSGDVIPYILEVIKGGDKGAKMPDFPYKWNNTNVDLILKDENDSNGMQIVTIKLLVHFFSTIGVKYLSEGILTKLVSNGYDSIESILKAKKKDLKNIDGLGEKMVDKIYEEIDRAFDEVELETFMGASNKLGRGFSSKKAKEIINMYPDIMKETGKNTEEMKEKIMKVSGFSDKLSEQFANNFKTFKKFYIEISKIKDLSRFENIKVKATETDNGIFKEKSFVFTGFRDKNIENFIVNNGGKITTSVSSNTFMVIYADNSDTSSSKFEKAKEKKIEMVKKSEFEKKFNL